MKRKFIKITGLWLILFVFVIGSCFTQELPDKEPLISSIVFELMKYLHYNPLAINDQLSQQAFDQYIDSLDYSKCFLLNDPDLKQLQVYKNRIDDEINNNSTVFMELANEILQKRISEVQQLAKELLAQPFDYNVNEVLETNPDKLAPPKNQAELRDRWRKILKRRVLDIYLGLSEESENQLLTAKKMDPQLEQQAREQVARSTKSSLARLLRESREEQYALYINSILSCFDSHTNYANPQQQEEFEISMSGTLEGIGATLSTDGEYVKVEQIVPGSASWRGQELKAGDLILKVGQGNSEPVDVANMPLNDVVRLIRGPKGTEVRLTVKSPDGQIKVISVVRDVVVIEETYARSAVIENEQTGAKLGYISLPSFYRDFNSKSARSSATDVRKELEELKAKEVAGIILDLRNNPGGALDDAVEMTGLFIEKGPVVQVRDKVGRVQVYSDPDPDIVTEVPLVVMVNSLSASAAEILAAALQDYGRAVIVGSPDTYGKGTVQVLLDMDNLISTQFSEYQPIGNVKLTTSKYYRINGDSVQLRGVHSDIVLPDPYGYLDIGEEHTDYPLSWDTITSLNYTAWDATDYDLTKLQEKSAQRIKASPAFQIVNSAIGQVKEENERNWQPLNFKEAVAERNRVNQRSKLLKDSQQQKLSISITSDLPKSEQNKDWLKRLNEDIYLEETAFILSDMLSLNQ